MDSKIRIEKIKKKYGKNAFRAWGMKGGSPILLAYKAGKLKIKK